MTEMTRNKKSVPAASPNGGNSAEAARAEIASPALHSITNTSPCQPGTLLKAALAYAARGWYILPLKPQGKVPLTPHGVKDATTDPQTIRDWWSRWPNANIGIACGPSRLLVVDLDGPEAADAWADLAQRYNIPYHTLTAHTGGGGIHLFYRVPDGLRLGNSAGRLGPHIDTRGDGGYIVPPPSVHPSGNPYVWENPDLEPLELPQVLIDLLTRKEKEKTPPPPRTGLHPYAEAALREETEKVRRAPVGTRNDTLNRAAFSLGQLVGGGLLDRMTAEMELTAAALTAGLEEREIAATIRSGLEAGIRQPRSLPDNGVGELITRISQLDGDLRDVAFEQELLPRLADLPTITRDRYIRQAAAALGVQETTVRRLVTSHLDGMTNRYTVQDGCICALRDGTARPLCNFTAEIAEDVARDDGETVTRLFTITGCLADGTLLQAVRVESDRFDKMTWVSAFWGARAVIRAGALVKDQLREAIQLRSTGATTRYVYTHTGWRLIGNRRAYLTAAGAVGIEGVTVELDRELDRYHLPLKPENPAGAMRASLRFLEVGPDTVTVPLWSAVYLAPLSEIVYPAFVLWLYGVSGALKSTLAALALSHYGQFSDKDLFLWNSTRNYLEKLCFLAKDALLVIDDFAPQSDPYRAREMEQIAAHIVRAVGNQAGRGRLTGDLSIRTTYRPRGMVVSTGEQVPDGLSETARTFTVEMRRGEIDLERLTAAQAEAARYPHALAGYILWLADNWDYLVRTLPGRRREIRTEILKTYSDHHLRVSENLATLYLALDLALTYATEIGVLTASGAEEWRERGWAALRTGAEAQAQRIERERPTLLFLEVLSGLVAQGKAKLYPRSGDREFIPEPGTELLGWYDDDYIYLLPKPAYHAVARFLREEGRHFPVKERTLWKHLLEEGYLLQNENDPHYTNLLRVGEKRYRVLQLSRTRWEDSNLVTTVTTVTTFSEEIPL